MRVWIARDKDGGLNMFRNHPVRNIDFFHNEVEEGEIHAPEDADVWELPGNMLPEVTWENSPKIFIVKMEFFQFKDRIKATE
jgi:hypothetical protein